MATPGQDRIERRLAAILAADVAGYSRLMGADEEGTLAQLNGKNKTLGAADSASHEHREDNLMKQYLCCLAAGSLLLVLSAGHPAWAQKRGGILRLASPASPANMSILETATIVDLPTRTPARFAKTNFA